LRKRVIAANPRKQIELRVSDASEISSYCFFASLFRHLLESFALFNIFSSFA
jgi:hypothetical protein